ncbi:hypothetical protein [Sporolactobacillus sp. KGMB 08714]|uniref:hypothetical protein n=1 Tax=Sporolactobacillus sp. KGMB 08714 TaxID=3064704 RepID=UPI002FBD6338
MIKQILTANAAQNKDDRTLGKLFYLMVDELADMSFIEAVQQLISLFQEASEDDPFCLKSHR